MSLWVADGDCLKKSQRPTFPNELQIAKGSLSLPDADKSGKPSSRCLTLGIDNENWETPELTELLNQ